MTTTFQVTKELITWIDKEGCLMTLATHNLTTNHHSVLVKGDIDTQEKVITLQILLDNPSCGVRVGPYEYDTAIRKWRPVRR